MQELKSYAWQVSIGRLLVLILSALIIGWLLDAILVALCVALSLYIAWSLYGLYRLQAWFKSRRREPPLDNWGVWSDVSEFAYRKLERQRSRKRRLIRLIREFRIAAQAVPDGYIALNSGLSILWMNQSAERLLGLNALDDRRTRLDLRISNPEWLSWLRGTPSQASVTNIAAPNDASTRLSARMIDYGKNQSLLVVRDITALTRLEQVRQDFVANVSHELRTPLTVLRGYVEMLGHDQPAESNTMLQEMNRQTLRMSQIVEDLLTLSRLDSQQPLEQDAIDMRAMLSSLAGEARLLSQNKHQIKTDFECNAVLLGSQKYLHSAFSNLVSNAIRYTPEGGSIAIAWNTVGEQAMFSVSDTGCGIPAEHLPRISERFYRVSESRSRDSGGTGLGLAIAKHVLASHDSALQIQSNVGQGSVFSCTFPAHRLTP